jgi:CRISP-associated protein Cas1
MIKRTLYFGSSYYLSKRLEQLVINIPNAQGLDEMGKQNTIPIEDIGIVVLDHAQISITQGLIESLLQNNVALIHCDSRHQPIGLVLPLESNDVQSQRFRHQIEATEPLRKQLWQQTIQAKIKNQALLLKQIGLPYQTLLGMASRVKSGDPDNLEAQAAAYYWARLFEEPLREDNIQFRRNREGIYPNALLNYGYAILRATVARALVSAGLLPTLGIHHSNKYNAYCLADDIMEPYRPFVDRLVYDLVRQKKGKDGLDKATKQALLSLPSLDVGIENLRSPLLNATHRTANAVYKCFAGQQRKILYPQWLTDMQNDLQLDIEME